MGHGTLLAHPSLKMLYAACEQNERYVILLFFCSPLAGARGTDTMAN
jgi:hypothetical protein